MTEVPSRTIPTVDLAGMGLREPILGISCALWIPEMASSAALVVLGLAKGVPA